MNKYSKRALKTTATVGMSLAMVLSGVAAPVVKVDAAVGAPVCLELNKDREISVKVLNKLNDVIGKDNLTTVKLDDKLTIETGDGTNTATKVEMKLSEWLGKKVKDLGLGFTGITATADVNTISSDSNIIDVLADLGDCLSVITSGSEDAKYLSGMGTGITALEAALGLVTVKFDDEDGTYDADGTTTTKSPESITTLIATRAKAITFHSALKADLDSLTDSDVTESVVYTGNLGEVSADELDVTVDKIKALMGEIEEAYPEYFGNDWVSTKFTTYKLPTPLSFNIYGSTSGVTTLGQLVARGNTAERLSVMTPTYVGTKLNKATSKTIQALIDSIESGKDAKGKTIKEFADYSKFAEDKDVIEIMDALNELLERALEVEAIIDEKQNDTLADLKSVKKNDLKADYDTLKGYVATAGSIDTDEEKAWNLIANIKSSELETLKTIKEDIIDPFYTAVVTEKSDKFVVSVKDGEYSENFNVTGHFATVYTDLFELLFQLDNAKENENTYYDVALAQIEGKDAALKALTKDLSGVTVSTLSSRNVDKVKAADEAFGKITGRKISSYYGGVSNSWEEITGVSGNNDDTAISYEDNLTGSESRTVNATIPTLKNLVAKMFALGLEDTDRATGWFQDAKGNWFYNDAEGNPVTKWVAAGKSWYYVKNGVMLTNAWVAQDSTGNVWYWVGADGAMVTNTNIQGYAINANGEWHK